MGIPSTGDDGPRNFESVFPSSEVCETPGEASKWTPSEIIVNSKKFKKIGTGKVDGKNGIRIHDESGVTVERATDMITCLALCENNPDCNAVNYSHVTGVCKMTSTQDTTGTSVPNISAYIKQ